MIGILITGHGEFATGLSQAAQMIAGPQKELLEVPFREDGSLDDFRINLEKALTRLSENNLGVLVLADLLGGTPFREVAVISESFDNVEIIAGANLPLIIEALLTRSSVKSVKELANNVSKAAKDNIRYVALDVDEEDDTIAEDGI